MFFLDPHLVVKVGGETLAGRASWPKENVRKHPHGHGEPHLDGCIDRFALEGTKAAGGSRSLDLELAASKYQQPQQPQRQAQYSSPRDSRRDRRRRQQRQEIRQVRGYNGQAGYANIQTGARGGRFYVNANGNKTCIYCISIGEQGRDARGRDPPRISFI